jgi:ABC-2 type transport system permease protein
MSAVIVPTGGSSLPTGARNAWLDTRVMVGRELRRATRSIDSMLTGMMMPVMILTLFVFVFGGAINTGSKYINYVVPGIILLCAGFGSAATAVSVAQDKESGTIDRFRTMPILGSAVLIGHVVSSLVRNLVAGTLVIGVAIAYGFRPTTSPTAWLLAIGVIVLYVLAFTWLSCAVGLLVSPDAATGLTFVLLFLPYVSSGFVPTSSMPSGLHAFAEHQPLTPIIETVRALLTGHPIGNNGLIAAAWCVGLMLVGQISSSRIHGRSR